MPSRWAAVSYSIAAKIGCTAQTLHEGIEEAFDALTVAIARAGVPRSDVATSAEGSGTREPRASAGQRDSCARH